MTHNLVETQKLIEQEALHEAQDKKRHDIERDKEKGEYENGLTQRVLMTLTEESKKYFQALEDKKSQNKFYTTFLKTGSKITNRNIVAASVAQALLKFLKSGTDTPLLNMMCECYEVAGLTLGLSQDTMNQNKENYWRLFGELVEHLAVATRFYRCETTFVAGRGRQCIVSDEMKEELEQYDDDVIAASCKFLPMVTKPNKHTDLLNPEGGYLTISSPLFKTPMRVKGSIPESLKNVNDTNYPDVFSSVNKQQETAYCVNTRFLKAVEKCYAEGLEWKKFPINAQLESNRQTVKEKISTGLEAQRLYVWKKHQRETTKEECVVVFRSCAQSMTNECNKTRDTLMFANKFAEFEELYFPIFMDSRYRRYTYAPDTCSYLGTSLSKSLYQFANKEALTSEGLSSLFVALGNALYYDKRHIHVREAKAKEWWEANKGDIKAGNYTTFFTDTKMDDPCLALAISLELVEYEKDNGYKTGIICHMDARCSGTSLIGTMLRDKTTMMLTSVIEEEVGESLPDAYMAVCLKALNILRSMEKTDAVNELLEVAETMYARGWFKKAVMTLSYGATEYTRNEEVYGLLREHKLKPSKCAIAMFNYTREAALKQVSPACMLFLSTVQEMTNKYVKEHGIVKFSAPLNGLPCIMQEFESEKKRYKLKTPEGKVVELVYYRPTTKFNYNAMMRWTAPSYVHAADAAVLGNVVGKSAFDVATIHDSFGSHPNYNNKLRNVYAEEMVILFEARPMDLFYKEMEGDVPPYTNDIQDSSIIRNSLHIIG